MISISPIVAIYISIFVFFAMVVIGLLTYYRSKKLVSQIQEQSDDAFKTANGAFESVQKLQKELTKTIEDVANISNLPPETWQVASKAEKNAQKSIDAIEEFQHNIDEIADKLDKLDHTNVQTDVQRDFDSIEKLNALKLKIDDIEAFIQQLADFVGFKDLPTPVELFGSEIGQPLIEAGFETLESIANAEAITIVHILPDLSFNKVKELIEQANHAYETMKIKHKLQTNHLKIL